MSWKNCRASIQSIVENLTPATTPRGRKGFRHVGEKDIEESTRDREFSVEVTSGPHRTGDCATVTPRYLTSCEIAVRYLKTNSVANDEDRITEDAEQIIGAILIKSNHHANFQALADMPDTTIEKDDERNYFLRIGFTVHHL